MGWAPAELRIWQAPSLLCSTRSARRCQRCATPPLLSPHSPLALRTALSSLLIGQAVGGLDKRAATAADPELSALLQEGVAAGHLRWLLRVEPRTASVDGRTLWAGLLNRQEAVSMLPVLALRVPRGG